MLHHDTSSDAKSNVISQLLTAREEVRIKLDELTEGVESSLALSNDAATQLAALHREHKRAIKKLDEEKKNIPTENIVDDDHTTESSLLSMGFFGVLGATLATAATGGTALPVIMAAAGGAAAGGAISSDQKKRVMQLKPRWLKITRN